ncbi:MAG TPA: YihY/virulence factor BrkB family protein [Chryseolinea sp.]|nr:YihY/virulence factor BrkB family protein [Chryseolinea sp.]
MNRVSSFLKSFWELLKGTFPKWWERSPFNNSVIIAYYTIFSLPGLLVIVINLAGIIFGAEAVTHQISGQISGMVGQNTAKDIEAIISESSRQDGTVLSTVLSIAILLFGATGVFYQLQQILNQMWEVKPKPRGKLFKLIKDRVFSFGLILVVGFLMLVSLILSAALSAVSSWVGSHISDSMNVLFVILDFIVSLLLTALLFAAIFKFLPDAKIRWRDVFPGAVLTAILFVLAKFALGIYFGKSDPGSAYGAAGTIVLIMLWVSYAGLIVLFGAEFTREYAERYGRHIVPTEAAVSTADHDSVHTDLSTMERKS